MSNHFTTIDTCTGARVDLYLYVNRGKIVLSTMVNNRSTKGLPTMDMNDLGHYTKALSLVLNGTITPENNAIYKDKPPK